MIDAHRPAARRAPAERRGLRRRQPVERLFQVSGRCAGQRPVDAAADGVEGDGAPHLRQVGAVDETNAPRHCADDRPCPHSVLQPGGVRVAQPKGQGFVQFVDIILASLDLDSLLRDTRLEGEAASCRDVVQAFDCRPGCRLIINRHCLAAGRSQDYLEPQYLALSRLGIGDGERRPHRVRRIAVDDGSHRARIPQRGAARTSQRHREGFVRLVDDVLACRHLDRPPRGPGPKS